MDIPNLNPIVGVVEAGANAVEKVAGVFTSNAEKDAQRSSEEQMALLRFYQPNSTIGRTAAGSTPLPTPSTGWCARSLW